MSQGDADVEDEGHLNSTARALRERQVSPILVRTVSFQ